MYDNYNEDTRLAFLKDLKSKMTKHKIIFLKNKPMIVKSK